MVDSFQIYFFEKTKVFSKELYFSITFLFKVPKDGLTVGLFGKNEKYQYLLKKRSDLFIGLKSDV